MGKELLKEAMEVILAANNSSGYCTCGDRTVIHRWANHAPVDTGDARADALVAKIKTYLYG